MRIFLQSISIVGILTLAACGDFEEADTSENTGSEGSGEESEENGGASAEAEEAEVSLRLGQSKAAQHPVSQGIDKFAELVNEKTDGEIYIDTFHDAALGSDREVIEGTQQGTLDLAASSTPNMASFTNLFMAWDLPYIFENKEEVYEAIDNEPGEMAKEEMEDAGFKVMFFPDYGFRQFVNNEKEVQVPSDMEGLKVRTTESPIEIADFEAWGAEPSPIAWGETFTALQQGTVEAEGNSYSLLWDSNHQEVLDYATEVNYNYSSDIVVMNKEIFDNLSQEHQDILLEAGQEAKEWQRELANEADEEAKQEFEDYGIEIYEPSEEEMNKWKQPLESVWTDFIEEGDVDGEYVDVILEEIGKEREDIFE